MVLLLLIPTASSVADPILKPRKYHGPIPKESITFTIGFIGGPNNEQMWDYLDRQVDQPLVKFLGTRDFGSSLQLDGIYTHKLHPQFAYRAKGGVGFLRSTSDGILNSTAIDTSGQSVLLDFTRDFDVALFSIELSGIYYFQDASVDEFQTFLGGGFSLYMPYATYKETLTDHDTGGAYNSNDKSKFSAEAGVHGLLGALYHIRNTVAFHMEARFQITQSKFGMELPTASAGIQNIVFDVDYTAFVISVGVSKFF